MDLPFQYDSQVFDGMTEERLRKEFNRNSNQPIEYFLQINKEERQEKIEELEKYALPRNIRKIEIKGHKDVMNIVLFGKTGHGKSATVNSMLHLTGTCVKESSLLATCTNHISVSEMEYKGQAYKIIDTPGLFNTNAELREIKFELSKIINECATGIDAFLFLYNGTVKFTPEEKQTIKELEILCGEEMTSHCFMVATHAESFLRETDLETYINKSTEMPDFHDFMKSINYRVIAVNNKTETPLEKRRTQDAIFDMVALVQHDTVFRSYTCDIFEKARFKHLEGEEKRRMLLNDARRREREDIQRCREFAEKNIEHLLKKTLTGMVHCDIASLKKNDFPGTVQRVLDKFRNNKSEKVKNVLSVLPGLQSIGEKTAARVFMEMEIKTYAEENFKLKGKDLKEIEEKLHGTPSTEERKNPMQGEMLTYIERIKELQRETEEEIESIQRKVHDEEMERIQYSDRVRKDIYRHLRNYDHNFVNNLSESDALYLDSHNVTQMRSDVIDQLSPEDRSVCSDAKIDQAIFSEFYILIDSLENVKLQDLKRALELKEIIPDFINESSRLETEHQEGCESFVTKFSKEVLIENIWRNIGKDWRFLARELFQSLEEADHVINLIESDKWNSYRNTSAKAVKMIGEWTKTGISNPYHILISALHFLGRRDIICDSLIDAKELDSALKHLNVLELQDHRSRLKAVERRIIMSISRQVELKNVVILQLKLGLNLSMSSADKDDVPEKVYQTIRKWAKKKKVPTATLR